MSDRADGLGARLLFFVGAVTAVVATAIGLHGWLNRPRPYTPIDQKAFNSEVALLGDGTPIFAPNGTVGRTLVDWLRSNDGKARFFEVGGTQFVGRSVIPTPEAKGRLTRLVMMLHSYPKVQVRVIGFTDRTEDPRADMLLSVARARWVADALADAGISRRLLSYEGRGGAKPIADNASAQGRQTNERVGFLLDPAEPAS